MSEKQEKILQEIIAFYKKNKFMPSSRYLQKKLNYRSHNSILQFMKILEKKNYLIRKENKIVLNDNYNYFNNGLKIINIINSTDKLNLILDLKKDYLAFKVKDNRLIKFNIIKKDILIIEKEKKIKNNDLGLFLINNNYEVYKYNYQDGFYILENDEEIYLNKVKTIGKVIKVERAL